MTARRIETRHIPMMAAEEMRGEEEVVDVESEADVDEGRIVGRLDGKREEERLGIGVGVDDGVEREVV